MRKPEQTAAQLHALIKERSVQLGPWPRGMTMLLYKTNGGWEVMISQGKTPEEENYRFSALWIALQMQNEFDLG